MNSDDEKKLNIDELFGPKDNSHVAKAFRGEGTADGAAITRAECALLLPLLKHAPQDL